MIRHDMVLFIKQRANLDGKTLIKQNMMTISYLYLNGLWMNFHTLYHSAMTMALHNSLYIVWVSQ